MTVEIRTLAFACLLLGATPLPAAPAAPSRQDQVHALSADVMPFDLRATTHVFTPTPRGGLQRVVTKHPEDAQQQALVRAHLRSLVERFRRRDFAAPAHVHGKAMPGLATLRAAAAQDLVIAYRDVAGGGEIEYSSERGPVVAALHAWFDAQLADHGPDALPGHAHEPH